MNFREAAEPSSTRPGALAAPRARYHCDAEGNALAAAFARGEIPEGYREQLLSPENISALHDALMTLVHDVDSQFAERRARAQECENECLATGRRSTWLKHKAAYDRWRASARRFKTTVESARRDVKRRMERYKREEHEAKLGRPVEAGYGNRLKKLRRDNHLLRTALAVVVERTGGSPGEPFVLADSTLEDRDAPYASLERADGDDGWLVRVERESG